MLVRVRMVFVECVRVWLTYAPQKRRLARLRSAPRINALRVSPRLVPVSESNSCMFRKNDRARADPLTNLQTSVFETFERPKATHEPHKLQDGTLWGAQATNVLRKPSAAEWQAYRKLTAQNVTCFTDEEQKHPINTFEQSDVCKYCGRERFRMAPLFHCCQGGKLLLHGDPRHTPSAAAAGGGTAAGPSTARSAVRGVSAQKQRRLLNMLHSIE